MTKPMTIQFYECEHEGDLRHYVDDMVSSGASIVSSGVNVDAEVGTVTFTVKDYAVFMEKFNKTDSADFVN